MHVGLIGLDDTQRWQSESACFALTETIRYWLREHAITAPFHKLLMLVQHEETQSTHPGAVAVTLGVCQARVSVLRSTLVAAPDDVRTMLRTIVDALGRVSETIGWHSAELDAFVHKLYTSRPPYIHVFSQLVKYDPVLKVTCSPFASFEPGRTKLGVFIEGRDGSRRDVMLIDRPAPVSIESEFPLASTDISASELVISDRGGRTLAKVRLERRS